MKNTIKFKSAAIILLFALSAMPLLAQPPNRQGTGDRQGQGQGQRQGQGQGQGQGQRQEMTEASSKERAVKLAESLGCTDEQKKKLVDFEVEQFKKFQQDREKMAGDREAMRANFMEQRKIREEKYAEILTPEQLKKYNQMMEERRQQRPEGSQSQGAEGQRSRGRGGN